MPAGLSDSRCLRIWRRRPLPPWKPPDEQGPWHIAKDLSVSKTQVSRWLSRIVKDQKAARNERMFDMWLACYSGGEIAEAVGINQAGVTRFLQTVLGYQTQKTS